MSDHNNCNILTKEYRIGSPDALKSILQMIRANLENGVIVEDAYWPSGQIHVVQPSFSSLPSEGPWPDYFEYYFRCVGCDCLFQLSVETYHGTGGQWKPWSSS